MIRSLRAKSLQNEKHKKILDSLNDLENFNIDFSILSRADDSYDSNSVKLNETDISILRKNLLFKHWQNETFNKFIEEKHACLRNMRYKQVLANGRECQEKIFIVKSGEMLVWIKINKNHIKNYKKQLFKYHVKEKLPQSDIKKAKSRFKRDNMVDINTICTEPRVNRSESGFSEISHTSIKTGEDPKQDEIVEIVKKEPITSRTRQSFSAVITSVNDFNFPTLHGLRLIRSALPGKRTVYHFHNNIKENENEEKIEEIENQSEFKKVPKEITVNTQLEKTSINNEAKQNNHEEKNDFVQKEKNLSYKSACYIKMMKLKPGQIFGLSDFLFDDTGEKESGDGSKTNKSKKFLESDEEDAKRNVDTEDVESENGKELNSRNLLNYYFVSNARQLECYVIDKEYYLKNMQTFTEDKNIISKYLQTLNCDAKKGVCSSGHMNSLIQILKFSKRNECVRTPTNELIDQLFVEQLDWNKHKQNIFNEQLKYRKKQTLHIPPSLKVPIKRFSSLSSTQNAKSKASLNASSIRKKFYF